MIAAAVNDDSFYSRWGVPRPGLVLSVLTYQVATLQFESYQEVSDNVFLEDVSQDLLCAFPPIPCICLVVSKTSNDFDLSLLTSPYPYILAPRP